MKYLCLDFGGTGVKYAIIDENFQLYDVNKENTIFLGQCYNAYRKSYLFLFGNVIYGFMYSYM